MHSLLVISAYMSMIFIPCACAQWGEVLTAHWWNLRADNRRRRMGMSEALVLAIAQTREAAEIEALSNAAFERVSPPRFVTSAKVPHLGRPKPRHAAVNQSTIVDAAARVAARLAALSEAHRLANTIFEVPALETPISAQPAIAAVRRPYLHIEAHPLHPTPTAAELDALYELDEPATISIAA